MFRLLWALFLLMGCSAGGTPNPPPGQTQAAFLFLIPSDKVGGNAYEPTIAVDQGGTEHILYQEFKPVKSPVEGRWAMMFGSCRANCLQKSNWQFVELEPDSGDEGGKPQLKLAPDGSLHAVWYQSQFLNQDHIVYATCAASCSSAANWNIGTPFMNVLTGHESNYFELDAQGRPRLVFYDDQAYFAGCDSTCTDAANWRKVAIWNKPLSTYLTLSLDSKGNPRVAFVTNMNSAGGLLHYAECNSDCLAASSWSNTPLFRIYTPRFDLESDPSGKSRLAFFQGGGAGLSERLYYGWCEQNCTKADAWSSWNLDTEKERGRGGVNLEFDPQGRPWVLHGYTSEQGLSICTAGCTSDNPTWQSRVMETSDSIAKTDPPPFNFVCNDPNKSSFWLLNFTPWLGFTPTGQGRIVYRVWNGETCGTFSKGGPSGLRYVQFGG